MVPVISGRADARANRARIIEAAKAVFAEQGWDAEIREICERSGVGMGTLYRNFATKDDLIAAMSHDVLGEVREAFTGVLAVHDPVERLRALANAVFDVTERHRGLMTAMRSGLKPERPKGSDPHFEEIQAMVREICAGSAIRKGLGIEAVMTFIRGMVVVYLDLRATMSAAHARRHCIDLFLHGVLTKDADR
jgi:AcrR family transcriptional regulator